MNKTLLVIRILFIALCAIGSWLLCYTVQEWDQRRGLAVMIGLMIGSLVVLVDRNTRSAKEVLAWLLKRSARARVVELESAALTAESAEALAADQGAWLEKRARERELGELARSLRPDQDLSTLERLHQELRVGRVPVHKPASAAPHS